MSSYTFRGNQRETSLDDSEFVDDITTAAEGNVTPPRPDLTRVHSISTHLTTTTSTAPTHPTESTGTSSTSSPSLKMDGAGSMASNCTEDTKADDINARTVASSESEKQNMPPEGSTSDMPPIIPDVFSSEREKVSEREEDVQQHESFSTTSHREDELQEDDETCSV